MQYRKLKYFKPKSGRKCCANFGTNWLEIAEAIAYKRHLPDWKCKQTNYYVMHKVRYKVEGKLRHKPSSFSKNLIFLTVLQAVSDSIKEVSIALGLQPISVSSMR